MVSMLFDRLGAGADYERLVVVQDGPSGLRAVIAVHSTALGPGAGGIRRMRYATEDDAVADALRLAEGMTLKCAVNDIPAGGAKTVVLDHEGLDRPAAYRALGRAVEALHGDYLSGPDIGTGDAELDEVRKETRHVNPSGNDAGAATARGVLAGIRGVLRVLEGDADPAGRTFVVQGLGSVGHQVAAGLVARGATVAGCDPDARARERAEAAGVRPIPTEEALTTACDVFVPCALGGVLTTEVATHLPARAVCGSANNQLADAEAAGTLRRRGVLYAPDFVVNAGAVAEGVFTTREGATAAVRKKAADHIDGFEETVVRILETAEAAGEDPDAVARAVAREKVRNATASG